MASATVSVDCENVTGELKHIWSSIDFDEINASYTERGKNLLKLLKGMLDSQSFTDMDWNLFFLLFK
jgi:hypothetical protein